MDRERRLSCSYRKDRKRWKGSGTNLSSALMRLSDQGILPRVTELSAQGKNAKAKTGGKSSGGGERTTLLHSDRIHLLQRGPRKKNGGGVPGRKGARFYSTRGGTAGESLLLFILLKKGRPERASGSEVSCGSPKD